MKDINKISTIVLWVAMIITAIVFGVFYYRISNEYAPDAGSILYWTYIILAVCLLAVVGFTVVQVVQRWRNNKKSLIPVFTGLISILVILAVAFFLGKNANSSKDDIWLLIADISLYSLYILLGLTCIALFAGIIWSYIKRTR